MRKPFIQRVKDVIWRISKKFHVEKMLQKTWGAFKMHVYERVRVHTYDPALNCHVTYLFGHRLHRRLSAETVNEASEKKVFYFKINRQAEYTLMCIQHWINVIKNFDCEFYFVCDNKQLEREIVRRLTFRDGDIKFMPSRRKELKNVARNLWTGFWEMATYAHLTPFYHAKENHIKEFWAIDADDTMFFLYPQQVKKILEQAQKTARENNISAFSLDMHWSQMKGKHWSLGVLYINDNVDFCKIFEGVKSLDWTERYKEIDDVFNLDWFFNYLRDNKMAAVETFYVEDCYFCHWVPNILRYLIGGNLCFWHEGKVTYPIIKDIYQNKQLGLIDIEKCYKISIGASLAEGLAFMENEVTILYNFSPKARKVFGLNGYGGNTKCYLPF